jgi:hypothetical protein
MKLALIDDWKKFYTFYSIWMFVLIGSSGDIYNAVVMSGLVDSSSVPDVMLKVLKGLALAGALSRIVAQAKTSVDTKAQDVLDGKTTLQDVISAESSDAQQSLSQVAQGAVSAVQEEIKK